MFKLTENAYGFDTNPVEILLDIIDSNGIQSLGVSGLRNVYLLDLKTKTDPSEAVAEWMEVEMGEFFNDLGEGEVHMNLSDMSVNENKCGLIIRDIELRPKESAQNDEIKNRSELFFS
ncbi:hypothetical protein GIB67_043298 [Kingdonia uniflora]|uniref:Uncharacterized protein n=1 Tax=Kingdonia uniflora TaxID=39325 RepID=A0A7J7NQV3_9MAGN|nr:hypothetical protein GIB67_043298 [Kingdonia uniflora]